MQNRHGNNSILAIGAVLLLIVAAAFIIFVDMGGILLRWLALFFLVFSGMASTLGFYMLSTVGSGHNKVFLRSGVGGALFLYLAVTLVLSFASRIFINNLTLYIMLNAGIIVAAAVVIIIVHTFSRRIAHSDLQTMGKKAFMDECERRFYNLLADSKNAKYYQELNKLHEMVKYSDKVGTGSEDYKIDAALDRLEAALASENEERAQTNIPALINEVNTLFNRRKGEVSESKRGGF